MQIVQRVWILSCGMSQTFANIFDNYLTLFPDGISDLVMLDIPMVINDTVDMCLNICGTNKDEDVDE